MNNTTGLTVQIHVNDRWLDAGEVSFRTPRRGLLSQMGFFYKASYLADSGCLSDPHVTDYRALTVNAPASLTGHYDETAIAPCLRDIIPQGFARQVLAQRMGVGGKALPSQDLEFLTKFCVSPIGNLRIKEAAESFEKGLEKHPTPDFDIDDMFRSQEALSQVIKTTPLHLLAGALGAGGDAPKLLVVQDESGTFHLEGTLSPHHVRKHWLVKFPRGRMSDTDRDIVRAEGIFYKALSRCGINTIHGADVIERSVPTLWLPRFDRSIHQGMEHRAGIESMYCLSRMIGDGARMYHEGVLRTLKGALAEPDSFDETLCEYLIRDVINLACGNTDNHGRNISLIKSEGKLRLSPAYDVAPMVLDDDGISRATIWSSKNLKRIDFPNYRSIIEEFATDSEATLEKFQACLVKLCRLEEEVRRLGLPDSVLRATQVDLSKPEIILRDLLL